MYSYLLFWFPRRTNDLSVTHHSLEIVCTCCLLTSGIDFYWIDIFKYCIINWALMLKCFIYKKLGVIVRWLIGTWSCAQGVQGLSKSNNQILNPVDVGPSIFIGNYVWFFTCSESKQFSIWSFNVPSVTTIHVAVLQYRPCLAFLLQQASKDKL